VAAFEIIRQTDFVKGRWLNGAGVSWDIAFTPRDASPSRFDWRFATAALERDAPFSVLPRVDRVITLVDGDGFSLDVEGFGVIDVDQPFVPASFPGDLPTICRLGGGQSRVLNLLLSRGRFAAEVRLFEAGTNFVVPAACEVALVFALAGAPTLTVKADRADLRAGDAAIVRPQTDVETSIAVSGVDVLLYAAVVSKVLSDEHTQS
jgi:environmental stress-induced protein Ves